MSQRIQIRRGTNLERAGVVFDSGEPVWTTDTKMLWIGDGVTSGGNRIVGVVSTEADLPTGINATKIANGSVSNTEFQFLDGVSSSIQTQFSNILDGTTDFTKLDVDNISIDSNRVSAVNTNGDLELASNGTGKIKTLNPMILSNLVQVDTLLSKGKGDILECLLSLSGQDDYSDIKVCHIFDNTAGTSMTDKLATGNNITLSSASSSSTHFIDGIVPVDNFVSGRYWQINDADSLTFSDGINDKDLTIIVAGTPQSLPANESVLFGKWDLSGGASPIEYVFSINSSRYLYFAKGDKDLGGYFSRTSQTDRLSDVGIFTVYGITTSGNTVSGIDLYVNGVKQSSYSDGVFGSYSCMRNTAQNVGNFFYNNGAVASNTISSFGFGLVFAITKKLSNKEMQRISKLLLGLSGKL